MDKRSPSRDPRWRLLAIGLDPDKREPELYGAIHEDERDTPLMTEGRVVFFADPARATELIERYGGPRAHDAKDLAKPTRWCDVAQALHHLSAGGIDESAAVVDAVNTLLDLLHAAGTKLGDGRRAALRSIADYCTTSKDLTKYLEEVGDHSSRELVDAVLWCVGAIVVKAKIL